MNKRNNLYTQKELYAILRDRFYKYSVENKKDISYAEAMKILDEIFVNDLCTKK